MNQPAGTVCFILSTTRSGSTWLALMLGSNPDAAYVGELGHMFGKRRASCALCAERGADCSLLHDAPAINRRDLHRTLLDRSGARVLIDNSKSLSWSRKHLEARGVQRKYLHIVRDPRAVVHAWRRRKRDGTQERWVRKNRELREFIDAQSLDYRLVTYLELATRPDETLADLSAWLGLTYDAAQRNYWTFEHHGPGRNGATSAFLENARTADDAFYAETSRRWFHDLRWRDQLDQRQQDEIASDPDVLALLRDLGLRLTDSGLERVESVVRQR